MALGLQRAVAQMTVFTIWIERISTGEKAPTFLRRAATEADARAYAEMLIADDADLRVSAVKPRNA